MKKKLALMVYPNFSMQEVASICNLFRWEYNHETHVFAGTLEEVRSEEGLMIKPHKTFADFKQEDYACLILSGCSDFRPVLRDRLMRDFLRSLRDQEDLVIGAICAGPMFLAQAGLLDNKQFINSLYVEINQMFPFIREENMVYEPVVVDGNIVTAVGAAFNEFAIAVAKCLGYECPDPIYAGITPDRLADDTFLKPPMPEAFIEDFKEEFKDLL